MNKNDFNISIEKNDFINFSNYIQKVGRQNLNKYKGYDILKSNLDVSKLYIDEFKVIPEEIFNNMVKYKLVELLEENIYSLTDLGLVIITNTFHKKEINALFSEEIIKYFDDKSILQLKYMYEDISQRKIISSVEEYDRIKKYRWFKQLPNIFYSYYNCNECKRFLRKYGDLYIHYNNSIIPIFWTYDDSDEDFNNLPIYLRRIIKVIHNQITLNIPTHTKFTTNKNILGIHDSNGWDHLHFIVEPDDSFYKKKEYS
jgi:hypothetical protein